MFLSWTSAINASKRFKNMHFYRFYFICAPQTAPSNVLAGVKASQLQYLFAQSLMLSKILCWTTQGLSLGERIYCEQKPDIAQKGISERFDLFFKLEQWKRSWIFLYKNTPKWFRFFATVTIPWSYCFLCLLVVFGCILNCFQSLP